MRTMLAGMRSRSADQQSARLDAVYAAPSSPAAERSQHSTLDAHPFEFFGDDADEGLPIAEGAAAFVSSAT
jgi:hypothetical protein